MDFLGAKAEQDLKESKQFLKEVKRAGYQPQLIRDLDGLD